MHQCDIYDIVVTIEKFRLRGFEEFESCRHIIEQILDRDDSAMSKPYRLMLDDRIHSQFRYFRPYFAVCCLGNHCRLADLSNTRQRLSTEPIATQIEKILFAINLGSSISLE